MASQEGCVTVNWEIRNFSLFLRTKKNQYLKSPTWELEETEMRVGEGCLGVCHFDSQIIFFVTGFGAHRVRTEMFFMSSNGDVLLNADPSRTLFELPKSALFDKNTQSILLNDTMTLRCRKWGEKLKTSECHFVAVLHSLNHLWTIEKLASSNYHDTYFEKEDVKYHVSLKRDEYVDWMAIVEGEPHAPGDLFMVDCALSRKDSCGRVLSPQFINFNDRKLCFSFNVDSNITSITLQLELIVALHGRRELSSSSQVVRKTPLEPNSPTNSALQELSAFSQVVRETPLEPKSPTNIAKHKNVSGALGDDFLLLYRDRALSDATLNTEGKSFSAHRAVLAARSPVFRAMFEKDETSEGRSGVVDIDDVDSETVDRMLVYLYADSVGDLAWKEASALYYAADKYEILPLKEKCADFLKDYLTADNACDVLVLADKHSDQELMTRVVDFILGHKEVVSSAQWGELEKGNPVLCAKITKELFLKRGKK